MTTEEYSENATLVQALREMLNSEAMKLAIEALENESSLYNTPEKEPSAALIDYGNIKGYFAYPRALKRLAYPPSASKPLETDYSSPTVEE